MNSQIFYSESPEIFFDKLQTLLSAIVKKELAENQPKESIQDDLIKINEVCKILKLSKPTIHKQVSLGFYQKHYVGRNILFSKKEILDFVLRKK